MYIRTDVRNGFKKRLVLLIVDLLSGRYKITKNVDWDVGQALKISLYVIFPARRGRFRHKNGSLGIFFESPVARYFTAAPVLPSTGNRTWIGINESRKEWHGGRSFQKRPCDHRRSYFRCMIGDHDHHINDLCMIATLLTNVIRKCHESYEFLDGESHTINRNVTTVNVSNYQ